MKKVRCALYDRVSHEDQVLHGISLAAQVDSLKSYANEKGYEIVGIYSDEGLTARKKLNKRSGFQALMNDVKQNKIDLILVTKLDRWFRNVRDYHNTQAILEAHHCNWKTIFEDYDTSTSDGNLKINIMLAVNQNEADKGSDRVKLAFDYKIKQREHVNGPVPYGYIIVNKKKQKDPKRKHIVDEIFSYYFNSFSKRKTIYYILDKYQKEDPELTHYKINRILGAEVYAGIYFGIKDYHPAYITEQQLNMIRNVSAAKTYDFSSGAYLFSGILKCPECGNNMTGFVKRQKLKDGSYSEYRRYRCSGKYSDHRGSGACLTEHLIEKYMLENLTKELDNQIYNAQLKLKKTSEDKTPSIKAEMERLNILFQKGRISEEYYDSQYEKLEEELSKQTTSSKVTELQSYLSIKKQFSSNWQDLYSSLDLDHKKIFWKSIIKEIHVDKESHKISDFTFLI